MWEAIGDAEQGVDYWTRTSDAVPFTRSDGGFTLGFYGLGLAAG
jgi:hypothetical protein